MICRSCRSELTDVFIDLGVSPPSNALRTEKDISGGEVFYPLKVFVCAKCFLVQLGEFETPKNIFSDYLYFSSYSRTWQTHAKQFANQMIQRLGLTSQSKVVEVASNDGCTLKHFQQKAIPVLGIEPAANVAQSAAKAGIPTRVCFFNEEAAFSLRKEGVLADLLYGNNVLAHVPDLHGFVAGLSILVHPEGMITLEFPHLLRMIQELQFDTIYHEHFSYFSLLSIEGVFSSHGLVVVDVEKIATHGGSLRLYLMKKGRGRPSENVVALRREEEAAGLNRLQGYAGFANKVERLKRDLLLCLIDLKSRGRSIWGYGAAAKGNTLLNYMGLRGDFIEGVYDLNPHKQGKFLPGSHLPVLSPDRIRQDKPDVVMILPWNIKQEIQDQLSFIRDWGGVFLVPIPTPRIVS